MFTKRLRAVVAILCVSCTRELDHEAIISTGGTAIVPMRSAEDNHDVPSAELANPYPWAWPLETQMCLGETEEVLGESPSMTVVQQTDGCGNRTLRFNVRGTNGECWQVDIDDYNRVRRVARTIGQTLSGACAAFDSRGRLRARGELKKSSDYGIVRTGMWNYWDADGHSVEAHSGVYSDGRILRGK